MKVKGSLFLFLSKSLPAGLKSLHEKMDNGNGENLGAEKAFLKMTQSPESLHLLV